MARQGDMIRVQCLTCKIETNHRVNFSENVSGGNEEEDFFYSQSYEIITCCGCGTISFLKRESSSEDYDPRTGEFIDIITLYPNRISGREPMDGVIHFPPKTRHIYHEVIKAINANIPLLAATGLRAVIEAICIEQGITARNLEMRINELANRGVLSTNQAQFLHGLRFMGNVAVHEIESPNPKALIGALDIAETLLKTIYVLPVIAAAISRLAP